MIWDSFHIQFHNTPKFKNNAVESVIGGPNAASFLIDSQPAYRLPKGSECLNASDWNKVP